MRELRQPVTPRHRRSDLDGKHNYVALLPSEHTRIEQNRIDGGEGCEQHQGGTLPQHPVIGQSPALADWPVS
jgi:hypothetical protein